MPVETILKALEQLDISILNNLPKDKSITYGCLNRDDVKRELTIVINGLKQSGLKFLNSKKDYCQCSECQGNKKFFYVFSNSETNNEIQKIVLFKDPLDSNNFEFGFIPINGSSDDVYLETGVPF